jgi:hypothetical protein
VVPISFFLTAIDSNVSKLSWCVKERLEMPYFRLYIMFFLPWFSIISSLKLYGRKEIAKEVHTIWEARRQPHINPSCRKIYML